MNILSLLNLLSCLLYMIAIFLIFFRSGTAISNHSIKYPLLIVLFIYLFNSTSNVLEHQGIWSYFDPIEDLVEIIYLPLFLVFINNWRKDKELRKLSLQKVWTDSSLESLQDGIITTDIQGRILHMNSRMEEMTGWLNTEARSRPASEILKFKEKSTKNDLSYNPFENLLHHYPAEEHPWGLYLISRQDKKTLVLEETSFIKGTDGEHLGMVSIFRDIEEYNSLMEQITHIHKMEAIGQLASGVAHDMNNMLAGILGAAETMRYRLSQQGSSEFDDILPIIFDSIANAKDLTESLLSFSRKKEMITIPIELKEIIQKAIALSKRALKEAVILDFSQADQTFTIKGNPSQLQNALMNLILNARDAYHGQKGTIKISTDRVSLDETTCSTCPFKVTPGAYIQITVKDEGEGIPPETQNRIFDPFFTTKAEGKGTGLGLAAVYGMIQAHHGMITVESAPHKGSSFSLFIPEAVMKSE